MWCSVGSGKVGQYEGGGYVMFIDCVRSELNRHRVVQGKTQPRKMWMDGEGWEETYCVRSVRAACAQAR